MKKIVGWGIGLTLIVFLQIGIAYGVMAYFSEKTPVVPPSPPIEKEVVCPLDSYTTFQTTNAHLFALLRKSSAKADNAETKIKELLEKGKGAVVFFGENGFQGNFLLRGTHDSEGYLFNESKMIETWHDTMNSFLFFAPETSLQLLRIYELDYFSGEQLRFCDSSFVSEMNLFERAPYKLEIAGDAMDSFMFEEF